MPGERNIVRRLPGCFPALGLAVSFFLSLAVQPVLALPACVGDCSKDAEVTVDELITMVNVALEAAVVSSCVDGDADGDGVITINEIILAVNNALNGCATIPTATATATPTQGGSHSYVGDYYGSVPDIGFAVRFHVAADGSANGFLDLPGGGAAASVRGAGGGGESYAASGQANLETGAYSLSGSLAGTPFQISGELPASPEGSGTLNLAFAGTIYGGTLVMGSAPPSPTPTPLPACGSGHLDTTLTGVSGSFNGITSGFVVELILGAVEQKAPDFIAGFHEIYNSFFNGTECVQAGPRLRNIQISLFGALGGLAGGQSYGLTAGAIIDSGAIIYYGEEGSGGDRVWSSSAGTLYIDSVQGSVVSMRIVDAAMTQTAGAATGSFMLNLNGQVNNFTRQLD